MLPLGLAGVRGRGLPPRAPRRRALGSGGPPGGPGQGSGEEGLGRYAPVRPRVLPCDALFPAARALAKRVLKMVEMLGGLVTERRIIYINELDPVLMKAMAEGYVEGFDLVKEGKDDT